MKGARGSILAQVLILSAVASLMCAAILRSRLQPALTAAGAVDRVRDDLAASAAVNRVTEVWARLGSCASDSREGVSCAGFGCDCVCAVSDPGPGADLNPVSGGPPATVTSASSGEACRLSAVRQ